MSKGSDLGATVVLLRAWPRERDTRGEVHRCSAQHSPRREEGRKQPEVQPETLQGKDCDPVSRSAVAKRAGGLEGASWAREHSSTAIETFVKT